VRGSQQVEETAADSLVFLYYSFIPHSCFCLYRRSLAPCVIDQGVLVLLDRHLLFTFRLALCTRSYPCTIVHPSFVKLVTIISRLIQAYHTFCRRRSLLHLHTHHSKYMFLPAHPHLSLVPHHHLHQVIYTSHPSHHPLH
jgi:hypothetical protein